MHEVERLASSPAPGRPDAWRDDLLVALEELGASIHEQRATSGSEESLLSDLMAEAPRLASSVEEVLEREQAAAERIDALNRLLAGFTRPIEVDEIREELAHITREIRDIRAWETDLVYEAHSVDLGVGD
jgi:hypothetical protein